MEIISTILSAWLAFGVSTDNLQQPIDEGVYKILPIAVNEVVWSDDTDKWRKLTRIALTEGYVTMETATLNSDKSRIFSIFFPVEKSIPHKESFSKFLQWLSSVSTGKVAIKGYASPDGKDPEHRYQLAKERANYISTIIKGEGVDVSSIYAEVCPDVTYKPFCWRTDVILIEGGVK